MTAGLWIVLLEWVVAGGLGAALVTVVYLGVEALIFGWDSEDAKHKADR